MMEENIGGDDSDKIDCGYSSRPMPSASRPLEKPAHPTSRPSSTSYQQSFPSDFSSVIFSRALDVACAAQKAQDHVVEAAKKAAYISELADMAYQEVDALHDVAADLATMAKSVAQTTMDICHFDSLEEAYKSSTAHKEKIDFESFVNVLHPEFSPHEVFLQRRPSNRLPRERLPLPSNSESRDGQRVVKPAPNSGASTGSSGHRRWSLPDRQCGSGPLRLFDQDVTQTQEKFPSRPSVEERKESMAAVFDNTHPITPLWEDRYCNVAREDEAVSTNTPSDNADQWQKKKAMKQFQIRLQHNQGLDSDNSAECLSSDRFESINNTNSKSIQQVRQKKNQLNPRNQQMYPDQSQKTPPAAENVHHSESESSLSELSSSDSEVGEILMRESTNKPLLKVKDLEKVEPVGKHYIRPLQEDAHRSVSPLLNPHERDGYAISGDEAGLSPSQKYQFTPATVKIKVTQKDVHHSRTAEGSGSYQTRK